MIPQEVIEEEKKSQAAASVKDTPASTQSVKAPKSKVAKSEAQTTPGGVALSSSAAEIKELPRHPSIPEENMPKDATATEGNASQAAMQQT